MLPDHGPPFIQINVRMYVRITADPPKAERMFDRLAKLLDFVQVDEAQIGLGTEPPSPTRDAEKPEQPVAT